ncbi:MAG: DUF167 domain-containing protein [Treponema sp.]|jgi:uncharacterized protein (TIGR00251 family)|nr:DUF167 domain-containing protein [Treponema sp.]
MAACIRIAGNQVYLDIKALPGSSASQVLDVREGRLRIKIAAAAEDGKANAELCTFLAKRLGCPKKAVTLCSGEKSRFKTVALPIALKDQVEALTIAHD